MKANKAIKEYLIGFFISWIFGPLIIWWTISDIKKGTYFDTPESMLGVPISLLLICMMIVSARALIEGRRMTSETTGKIVSVGTPLKKPGKSHQFDGKYIDLYISYMVEGCEFQTKGIKYFTPNGRNSPSEYIGKEVTVCYNPRNPQEADPIIPEKLL